MIDLSGGDNLPLQGLYTSVLGALLNEKNFSVHVMREQEVGHQGDELDLTSVSPEEWFVVIHDQSKTGPQIYNYHGEPTPLSTDVFDNAYEVTVAFMHQLFRKLDMREGFVDSQSRFFGLDRSKIAAAIAVWARGMGYPLDEFFDGELQHTHGLSPEG